jgi:hypothetical protein
MKLAAGIIGLIVGLLVLMQSCALTGLAALDQDSALTDAGYVGIFTGLMFFVGGAFAFGVPLVGAVVFVFAALVGFTVASDFGDMQVWGLVALALATLSFCSWRSTRRPSSAPPSRDGES